MEYIKLADKIEQSNRNIEYLISLLIDKEMHINKLYCCDPEEYYKNGCEIDCDECKKQYYDNKYNTLSKRYLIT